MFLAHAAPSRQGVFKGFIMDRWVLLTSTPSCVVSLRAKQHKRDLMSTRQTYPWLIPIITWCRQFTSSSANILLIKCKLQLEPRTVAVDVAMSRRNPDDKNRFRPTPGDESAHANFLREPECISRGAPIAASSFGDNVDHMVCLKLNSCRTLSTVLSNENGEFYTDDIYP